MKNSKIKIKFGRYKGLSIDELPEDYLRWCVENQILKGRALVYAKELLGYPKDQFQVIVEDAVTGDGVYIVKAYSSQQAINTCKKKFNIKCTQSYCGTSFTVKPLKIIK